MGSVGAIYYLLEHKLNRVNAIPSLPLSTWPTTGWPPITCLHSISHSRPEGTRTQTQRCILHIPRSPRWGCNLLGEVPLPEAERLCVCYAEVRSTFVARSTPPPAVPGSPLAPWATRNTNAKM